MPVRHRLPLHVLEARVLGLKFGAEVDDLQLELLGGAGVVDRCLALCQAAFPLLQLGASSFELCPGMESSSRALVTSRRWRVKNSQEDTNCRCSMRSVAAKVRQVSSSASRPWRAKVMSEMSTSIASSLELSPRSSLVRSAQGLKRPRKRRSPVADDSGTVHMAEPRRGEEHRLASGAPASPPATCGPSGTPSELGGTSVVSSAYGGGCGAEGPGGGCGTEGPEAAEKMRLRNKGKVRSCSKKKMVWDIHVGMVESVDAVWIVGSLGSTPVVSICPPAGTSVPGPPTPASNKVLP